MDFNQTIIGDSLTILKTLPDELVDCVVTSPPYFGLRNYEVEGQIGLEKTPEDYVSKLVEIFGELKRVLKSEGTFWLNLGDSYGGSGKGGQSEEKRSKNWQPKYPHDFGRQGATSTVSKLERGRGFYSGNGIKPKDLIGVPWMVAFALRKDGWYLRSEIILCKRNPMPESVQDRPTSATEKMFLFTKSSKYFYDIEAVKEPSNYPDDNRKERSNRSQKRYLTELISGIREGSATYPTRNLRNWWPIVSEPLREAHDAVFGEKWIEPCIKAGCPVGGLVLDPFMGSGTTGRVATKLNRNWLGIELNLAYGELIKKRTNKVQRILL